MITGRPVARASASASASDVEPGEALGAARASRAVAGAGGVDDPADEERDPERPSRAARAGGASKLAWSAPASTPTAADARRDERRARAPPRRSGVSAGNASFRNTPAAARSATPKTRLHRLHPRAALRERDRERADEEEEEPHPERVGEHDAEAERDRALRRDEGERRREHGAGAGRGDDPRDEPHARTRPRVPRRRRRERRACHEAGSAELEGAEHRRRHRGEDERHEPDHPRVLHHAAERRARSSAAPTPSAEYIAAIPST